MRQLAMILSAVCFSFGMVPAHGATERPEVQKGDAWTYEHTTFPAETKRTFTLRVRDVSEETIVTGSATTGSTFGRDWAQREQRRAGEVVYRSATGRPLLKFPMDVGSRWSGNVVANHADGYVQDWQQARAVVEKTERVTVPAGTFDTLLIRFEGYYPARDGRVNVRWVESIWYAPEAGRWVKRDWTWSTSFPQGGSASQREFEQLVSFKRNASAAAKSSPVPENAEGEKPKE